MIGIIIVAHGKYAEGLLDAVYLIAGQQEKIETIGLFEGDNLDDLTQKIAEKIDKLDDGSGVIVFVDMFGASPSNIVSKLMNKNFVAVTGVNLPMILEILMNRDSLNLDDIAKLAIEAGKESIMNLTERIKEILNKKI
ncbi:PTS sugar transporter subunit IIA [Caldisericum sp.]|jgi:mannose/fructose/sorbose-specific phosphotransferase system IIA component|uniref:PTS sugar transporter subunit IIA n=1 Tax=Caldisericum sp. TaxID=2499687 RepID=UPI003CBE71A1